MTSPSEQEEQWFREQERKKNADNVAAADHQAKVALRDAHYMKCPKCGNDLEERTYETISIDQCKGCNGVWLDPGELEQLKDDKAAGGFFGFLRGK